MNWEKWKGTKRRCEGVDWIRMTQNEVEWRGLCEHCDEHRAGTESRERCFDPEEDSVC